MNRSSKELSEADYLKKMEAYCARAEHCCSEVSDKLKRSGVSDEAIERILDTLQQEKYIDEERYCRAFIRDKYRFAKWGRVKIAQMLKTKKIPRSLYFPLMDEIIDPEEYRSVLRTLLVVQRRSIRACDQRELYNKLIRFAIGRGFEIEEIQSAID